MTESDSDDRLSQQIRQQLLAYLQRRDYSQLELKQRLLRKGQPLELIEQGIAQLVEQGWQSDQRYAEIKTRSLASKGKSARLIRQQLAQQGVSKDVIDEQLEDFSWQEVIWLAAQKRQTLLHQDGGIQRLQRWLAARGFTYAQVNWAIAKLQEQHLSDD